MSGPATLEHFRGFVTANVAKIGRGFVKADDDWMPVAFLQNAEGLTILTLANDLFASGLRKEVLALFLRDRVVRDRVFRYALLLNVHQIKQPSEEQIEAVREERARVEQFEGATEHLLLLLGDAEEEQVWMAPILRQTGTLVRKLGRWERMDQNEGWSFEGRFAGLNEAMR